jgi:hypothetical protein
MPTTAGPVCISTRVADPAEGPCGGGSGKRAATRSLLFQSSGGPLLMEDPMRFELKVVLSVEAVVLIAVALKVLQVW